MPQVDGVRHTYVDCGGLRVHLAEAGPPDGEPVLLLHGWPQHWYEWRGVVPALSQRYRLLMPDLRGLGWTEVTRRGYEKEQLAYDQLALLDALGIERTKLMGHDWGGYAGFILCALAPQRIERFVVANVGHLWPKPSLRSTLNFWRFSYQLPMLLPFIGPRVTRLKGFIKYFIGGREDGVFTDDELEAFEAPLRDPKRSPASAGYYRSFMAHDLPKLLMRRWNRYRLTVPTLMLYGTKDFVIRPSMLEGFERFADDMRIEHVEGRAHFVVDSEPDLVAQRALEFFSAR
jgi:pimeloyl-ACP methyl ester carboxylesterase